MPKYVIERDIPWVGRLSTEELTELARRSCTSLQNVGRGLQWVRSHVTEDKVYCEYIAPDEAAIRDHAGRAGFPVSRISKVATVIDPVTAE